MLQPSTLIHTVASGTIRWRDVRYVANVDDRSGLVAWVADKAVALAGNTPAVEVELRRLADERDREAIERFCGPMEPWSGGDGQERLRLAIALAELHKADAEVARIEAEIARLEGRTPEPFDT